MGATRQLRQIASRRRVGRDHRTSLLIAEAFQGNVGRVEGRGGCEKVRKPPRLLRRNCPPLRPQADPPTAA
eukprot:2554742-Prymnesium_polylepis.1